MQIVKPIQQLCSDRENACVYHGETPMRSPSSMCCMFDRWLENPVRISQ
jgi:hypothetical protein